MKKGVITKKRGSVTKEKSTNLEYSITIKAGDVVMVGTGATALEALQSIPRPAKIVSKGIVIIECGELKKEMVFPALKLRRIFYPNAQPILIKWLAAGLK